jgi:hypothetical protein
VFWENETPYCNVLARGQPEKRALKLGRADDQRFVVLEGLAAGDRVQVP